MTDNMIKNENCIVGDSDHLVTKLKEALDKAVRIDLLVAFLMESGVKLIAEDLKKAVEKGIPVRILTGNYLNITEPSALYMLKDMMGEKVDLRFYNVTNKSFHPKAYFFEYEDGGDIFLGSSNLSRSALTSGIEWNYRVSRKTDKNDYEFFKSAFEDLFLNHSILVDDNELERYSKSWKKPKVHMSIEDKTEEDKSNVTEIISPRGAQVEALYELKKFREEGLDKGMVVAATGIGKTYLAAFDCRGFSKVLFVAHREEILNQAMRSFKNVRPESSISLFSGSTKDAEGDIVFATVQTLGKELYLNDEYFKRDAFDYIVIDEFHHAAAGNYQKIIDYFEPEFLLGITATPERHDGKDILQYFDNRITAEMRLPEAIDRKLLCPFQYFGVSDSVDLSNLKWSRGGYDSVALSNLYTGDSARADMIIKAIHKYVTDINDVKGLAFCVSVEHAKFMAENFNKYGIPSISLDAKSSYEVRRAAPRMLTEGKYKFIFVVDLYNEGVDIPEINTVLFLRPTESLTVFLQQLGRGLRTAEDKECLTVLDFVGQANKKYNFEEKINSLMSSSRGAQYEIKNGFPNLPKGCYVKLEKKAQDYILDNIRKSFGTKLGLISKIANFSDESGLELNLNNFVNYYHMEIRSIYKSYSFSRLCVEAGIKEDFMEDVEEIYTKAFSRICSIDSRRWIRFLLDVLVKDDEFEIDTLNGYEKRMLQMFQYTIWQKSAKECGFKDEKEGIIELKKYPILFREMIEILNYCYEKIDFVDEEVKIGFECPLDLHCSYSRDQILVAMDYTKPSSMQTGVKYFPDKGIDLFLVTLNKAQKDYSPTTMYNDYSVNEELFHWQSQNATSPESPTGKRYIGHSVAKNKIMLFVREYKTDASGTSPYTYLGLVDYVSHTDSKPMNILWRLKRPIPARFISKTNKLVAG